MYRFEESSDRSVSMLGNNVKPIEGDEAGIHKVMGKGIKCLLIDDDKDFGDLLTTYARTRSIDISHFTSLVDLGTFALIKDYDVVLLDYHLEHLTGLEIADYVETFFSNVPVVIISADNLSGKPEIMSPQCVRRVIDKKNGIDEILDAAEEVHSRQLLIDRYS